MSEIIPFISRNTQIETNISNQIEILGQQAPLKMPKRDSILVTEYVNKIEGTYDTRRAKHDTDHAIELLYIAYNTTPQEQGGIRVKISAIMNQLIKAQQESERNIKAAIRVAEKICKTLADYLPDWLDVKESEDAEEIKAFVRGELIEMARTITTAATTVRNNLQKVASSYDQIIADTTDVTASSELALSNTLESNEKVRQEIARYNSRRATLESLVQDLQVQVAKYEKLSREYAAQAKSAEQRSFWGAVLHAGAQLMSSLVPVAAMAASGGASAPLMAASTVGALVNRNTGDGESQDSTGEMIRMKKERSEHIAQSTLLTERITEMTSTLNALLSQRATEKVAAVLRSLDERIKSTEDTINKTKATLQTVKQEMGSIESALNLLSKKASSISEESKRQADNLRTLQLAMIENAEKYENARRDQAAELAEVSVLLASKRTEQETIQLAVKSLNLSVSALKRTKEIVEEMAFFFKSFSDFMEVIVEDSAHQVEYYENAVNSPKLRANRLRQLRESTDAFFISQHGQWLAVGIVSDRFVQTFKDGWSKLNTLSGSYITGDKLPAYLQEASEKLLMISQDREEASHQRMVYLQQYRSELNN